MPSQDKYQTTIAIQQTEQEYQCLYCDNRFWSIKKDKIKFCSSKCRTQHHNKKRANNNQDPYSQITQRTGKTRTTTKNVKRYLYKHICIVCGKEIYSTRSTGISYCSEMCRKRMDRKLQKEIRSYDKILGGHKEALKKGEIPEIDNTTQETDMAKNKGKARRYNQAHGKKKTYKKKFKYKYKKNK